MGAVSATLLLRLASIKISSKTSQMLKKNSNAEKMVRKPSIALSESDDLTINEGEDSLRCCNKTYKSIETKEKHEISFHR